MPIAEFLRRKEAFNSGPGLYITTMDGSTYRFSANVPQIWLQVLSDEPPSFKETTLSVITFPLFSYQCIANTIV